MSRGGGHHLQQPDADRVERFEAEDQQNRYDDPAASDAPVAAGKHADESEQRPGDEQNRIHLFSARIC
ncbi:MAG: hypothetical protein L6W00_01755 [Lentisphaeria bacterium]|nr:MAG: hypothetical protein L6W00_01755 [Lentisphaeria bacterium]